MGEPIERYITLDGQNIGNIPKSGVTEMYVKFMIKSFQTKTPWLGRLLKEHNLTVEFEGDLQIHRHEFVSEERKGE